MRGSAWLRPTRLLSGVVVLVVLAAAVVGAADGWVRHRAANAEYGVDSLPPTDVALVLGAEVYPDGRPSPYLASRLDLGAQLLRAGKVKALLLSGSRDGHGYDEPDAMRRYLVAKGVPAAKTVLDFAGFDTYQSCARAYRVFGVRRAVAVTQDFSVARTVALCRSAGIATTVVADHGQAHNLTYDKCWLRDQFADTKAVYSILAQPAPTDTSGPETSIGDAMAAGPR